MTTLKFKCHLDSNVVLNQSAATEGSNSTLDFIPGNVIKKKKNSQNKMWY